MHFVRQVLQFFGTRTILCNVFYYCMCWLFWCFLMQIHYIGASIRTLRMGQQYITQRPVYIHYSLQGHSQHCRSAHTNCLRLNITGFRRFSVACTLTSLGCLKIGRLIFGYACNRQFQSKFSKNNIFVRGVLSGLFRRRLQVYAALGVSPYAMYLHQPVCNVFEPAFM